MFKILSCRLAYHSFKRTSSLSKMQLLQSSFNYAALPYWKISKSFNSTQSPEEKPKISWHDFREIIQNNFTQATFQQLEKQLSLLCNQEKIDDERLKTFRNQYSILCEALDNLDLETFLNNKINFEIGNQEEIVSLIKLITVNLLSQENNQQSFSQSSEHRMFLLIALFILKTASPSNLFLISLCETKLQDCLRQKSLKLNSSLVDTEKKFFLKYIEKSSKFQRETIQQIHEYLAFQIQRNPIFSNDAAFLLATVNKIEQSSIKVDFMVSQLLQHETPFQILEEKPTSLEDAEEIHQRESSDDLSSLIQNIVLNNINLGNELPSFEAFSAYLGILRKTNYKTFHILDKLIISLEQILQTKLPKDPAILIDVSFKIISESGSFFPLHRELLKKSLRIIYNFLYDMPLTFNQTLQVYSIFRYTQTFDPKLLNKIQGIVVPKLMKLEIRSFLNFFFFYSVLPSSYQGLEAPKRDINMYVKSNFKKFSFENLLDIVNVSLQLDFQEKVDSVAYLPVLDSQLWSQIFEILLQTKPEKISLKEKVKFFRILKILSFVIKGDVFNYPLIQQKIAALSKTFQAVSTIIESDFQREVQKYLDDMWKSYTKEKMIEDLFFVDFTISKKRVLEVNGPTHYFIIFNEKGEVYAENKSTEFKRRMLQMLGYEYFAIPFYEWLDLPDESKRLEYVRRKLMKLTPAY